MKRDRNILSVPLTDEQAALLDRARVDKNGGMVSRADMARHALFNVFIPSLGYAAPAPMPLPQSERVAKPRPSHRERTARRRERQSSPQSLQMTELQRRAADEGHQVPGKGMVDEDGAKKKFVPAAPAPTLDGTGNGFIEALDGPPVRGVQPQSAKAGQEELQDFRYRLDTALGRNR